MTTPQFNSPVALFIASIALLSSLTTAQVITVDAFPSTSSRPDSLTLRNGSEHAALASLSPASLLPSAVMERLTALLAGYLSQGTIGLIAFAVIVLAALLCLRQLVSCLHLSSWHRRVYALVKTSDDADSLSKKSPHRFGARHSQKVSRHTAAYSGLPFPTQGLCRLTFHLSIRLLADRTVLGGA